MSIVPPSVEYPIDRTSNSLNIKLIAPPSVEYQMSIVPLSVEYQIDRTSNSLNIKLIAPLLDSTLDPDVVAKTGLEATSIGRAGSGHHCWKGWKGR